jgi:hypothetical protein
MSLLSLRVLPILIGRASIWSIMGLASLYPRQLCFDPCFCLRHTVESSYNCDGTGKRFQSYGTPKVQIWNWQARMKLSGKRTLSRFPLESPRIMGHRRGKPSAILCWGESLRSITEGARSFYVRPFSLVNKFLQGDENEHSP